MINHHPEFELLFDYASGALPEPMALSIACHASTCKKCAEQIAKLEEVGGTLLEVVTEETVSPSLLDDVLARLDDPANDDVPLEPIVFDAATKNVIPTPLRNYLTNNLDSLEWRNIGSNVSQYKLDVDVEGYKVSLMRFKAGAPMPIHTHKGNEATLVLAGGYTDQGRHFERGDFDVKDPSDTHQPIVDHGEDCVALVVTDAPVVLAGPLSRFLNPFIKI